MTGDLYQPTIPNKARDVVYWVGLITTATALLVTGLANIWFPAHASEVQQTALTIGNTVGIFATGLGVVYRPGAQDNYTPQHTVI